MTDWKSKVLSAIDAEQEQLLELCSQLIRFPSENPPGDSRDISSFIMEYLKQAGIDTEVHPATETMLNLVSTLKTGAAEPSDKKLIFCGHTDVVPAGDRSRWDFAPFCGDIVDGYLLGSGAADRKAGLAGLIFAMGTLSRLGVHMRGDLDLLVVRNGGTDGHLGEPWVIARGQYMGTASFIAGISGQRDP
ncbi:succinyl-diaminopimelate desuccinylase, partial [Paenibacillus riograndensis]